MAGVGLSVVGLFLTVIVAMGLALCGFMAALVAAERMLVSPDDFEPLNSPQETENTQRFFDALRRVLWTALTAAILLGAGSGMTALTCESPVSSDEAP